MKKKLHIIAFLLFVSSVSVATSQTLTIGSGTVASTTFPFYNYYENNQTQILFLQSELGTAKQITTIGLDIKYVTPTAQYRDMANFTIKLKHTSTTSFGTAYESMAGATTVYSPGTYVLPSSTGVFTMDITDFSYDGTNNLIVEILWGDNGEYCSSSDSYTVNCTTNASYMVVEGHADSETPPTYDGRSYNRPNVVFGYTAEPIITTTSISSITPTSATGGGNITHVGTSAVTVSGVCWNTSTNPTTSNSKTTDGPTSATSFSTNLTSLSAQTYYYVRAYATNTQGTGYGSNVNFWTLSTEPTNHSASFTATANGSTQIDLTFNAASGYGADGYILLRKTSSAPSSGGVSDGAAPGSLSLSDATLVTTITSDAATSYSNTGLTGGNTYYYLLIPYNYNGSNNETYNYYTGGTIPGANAYLAESYTAKGLIVAGDYTNNGTFIQTSDDNYFGMTGTSKSMTGSGTYTNAKVCINGTITYNGTSTSELTKTMVNTAKTFTINNSKTYYNGRMTINGTLVISATSSEIRNSANWTNNGTFTANTTSLVTFNGSSGTTQTIGGTASSYFYNATINNTSGNVTLGINTTITNTLTLTSGKIYTSAYTLNIGTTSSNGSISGGSSSTYIVAYDNLGTIGSLKRFVNSNAAYSYPIGDASNYTPLTFTLTSNGGLTNAYLTIHTKNIKIPGLNEAFTAYLNRYWNVTESGFTSPTYDMTYTYVDADLVGSETGMLPIKKSGSTWYKPTGSSFSTPTAQGTGSFNAGTNTLTWTGLSTFSFFSGVPDLAVTLPIELISFTGEKNGNNNILIWETSSEHNNDFFTIEKTTDGTNYEVVGTIDGAGNSGSYLQYMLTDYDVREVINYYRLKQTDFDGKYTFTNDISIDNRINSSAKEIKMITNILGQEVNEYYRGVVIIMYSDGTSKKVIQ